MRPDKEEHANGSEVGLIVDLTMAEEDIYSVFRRGQRWLRPRRARIDSWNIFKLKTLDGNGDVVVSGVLGREFGGEAVDDAGPDQGYVGGGGAPLSLLCFHHSLEKFCTSPTKRLFLGEWFGAA